MGWSLPLLLYTDDPCHARSAARLKFNERNLKEEHPQRYGVERFSHDTSTPVQTAKCLKTFLHPSSSQERFTLRHQKKKKRKKRSLSWPWGARYLVTNENETFALRGTPQAPSRGCCSPHSKERTHSLIDWREAGWELTLALNGLKYACTTFFFFFIRREAKWYTHPGWFIKPIQSLHVRDKLAAAVPNALDG